MRKILRYSRLIIQLAFTNIKRHFGLAFSAAFSVFVTLTLVSIFTLIVSNISYMSNHIETQLTIRASLNRGLDQKEKNKVKEIVSKMDGVESVIISSKDEELENYKSDYSTDYKLFEMYEGSTNPISDAIIVEVKSGRVLKSLSRQIGELEGIDSVTDGGDLTEGLLNTFYYVRIGGTIFVAILLLITLLMIINKIKMSIYTRRKEIEIMRVVGAGNWYIRLPMMIEGMIIGAIGALPAALFTLFGYDYLYRTLGGIIMSNMFTLMPTLPLANSMAIGVMICGIVVGFLGSGYSTTRHLRLKR